MICVVRVFISYSRRDAAFVERLRRGLEADGNDVWVDTEDIRGSDQWRASIVEGLRQADVMLLLVSPASMASENVEREVNLAAEVKRRILPIVLAPAEMTGSIAFELAGVQELSFVGRPFDDALDELRRELKTFPAAGGAAPPPPLPAPRPDRPSKRPVIIAVVAGAVVVLALLVTIVALQGGGDGKGERATGAETSAAAATTATDAPPAPDAVTVDVDGPVWFAGFAVTVETATYDEANAEVALTATFVNNQAMDDDPKNILGTSTALLWGDGRRSGAFCPCAALPPGAMERDVIHFEVDDSFTWEGAELVFGSPGQHQAFVPLDGRAADSATPRSYAITGTTDDGAGTSFSIEEIDVVPAACSGFADALGYTSGPDDHVSLVAWGTALATANGTPFGVGQLVLPDGTVLTSASLNTYVYALTAGVPEHGVGICFDIPFPFEGEYRLVVKAVDVTTDLPGFSFSL
jgi:TIR domain